MGQKSNINHESQTLKVLTIKNHQGGDPEKKQDGGDTAVTSIQSSCVLKKVNQHLVCDTYISRGH